MRQAEKLRHASAQAMRIAAALCEDLHLRAHSAHTHYKGGRAYGLTIILHQMNSDPKEVRVTVKMELPGGMGGLLCDLEVPAAGKLWTQEPTEKNRCYFPAGYIVLEVEKALRQRRSHRMPGVEVHA